MQAAYTWSKALGTTGSRGDFHRIDNLTRFANYGPIDLDRRQNVAINYTYDFPSLARYAGNNWLTRGALNGWQISGLTQFQSGSPYGVGFSIPGIGSPQITGSYTEGARVSLIGNPLAGTSDDPYHRLNPAAFTVPPVGSIGLDSPIRYLTNPGISRWDISLQKEFVSHERWRFQFRADGSLRDKNGFGTVSGARDPRILQLMVRIQF